jgi:hypothetical protein
VNWPEQVVVVPPHVTLLQVSPSQVGPAQVQRQVAMLTQVRPPLTHVACPEHVYPAHVGCPQVRLSHVA